jgi:DNA-binding MarR family transcriptional regulator
MDRPEIVRSFNRFYTKQIHLLQEGVLDSPLSLTEARVLFELANRENPTATELGEALALDAGDLSRILDSFVR